MTQYSIKAISSLQEWLKRISNTTCETSVGVNIRYTSALFERSHIRNDYKVVFTFPDAPEQGRGGLILPADGDISRKSLTFLAGCFRLGMQFVVLIQFTVKG